MKQYTLYFLYKASKILIVYVKYTFFTGFTCTLVENRSDSESKSYYFDIDINLYNIDTPSY